MTEPQERLDHLEMQRRAAMFNMNMTQAAMEYVFAERRRQIKKGRDGDIPFACESPGTSDIFRLGVLGEEFGEVCTAIIERQGHTRELEEYCHTAAVALACMEGMMKKLGMDPHHDRVPEWQAQDESPSDSVDTRGYVNVDALSDEYTDVLMEVRRIYEDRTARRGPLWRKMGARGQLVNMRTCVERLWNQFYNISDEAMEEMDLDVDDALDLINYTVFLVLCLKRGSRDGDWTW